ncbi:hypothetical protein L6452_24686 [Arctium lappa]|uniref:Uncharacterized protein n=1 Tax=Arctium lappa TaxID=4217 RepID=A0ACB9A9S4_ARCLA|nr:hypothetical protein L6452_24686 [Arctium lappa]
MLSISCTGRQEKGLFLAYEYTLVFNQSMLSSDDFVLMGPRLKGKGLEVKAADFGSSVFSSQIRFSSNAEQTDLLNQACFGRPISSGFS